MNDYIIAVDRDGQPYIAHAWGRGANGQHKYIAKIGEGAKARYFYTQEQLRAFQQGARQGAQNAANKAKEKASDAVGRARENSVLLNVGNQYNAAKRAHENSKSSDPQKAKWGKEGYESNNTLGGKAYKAQQKVKDTVKQLDDKRKEIQNKHTTVEKGGHTIDEWSKTKEGQKALKNSKLDNKNEITETVLKETVLKEKVEYHPPKSKFSEYKKGDKDFDDKNFDEKNRVGNSDFFMAKRSDGSTIILEEDMKWVLPIGVNPNDPAIKRALTKEYKADSNEEWVKQVTEAIDKATAESIANKEAKEAYDVVKKSNSNVKKTKK